MASPIVSYKKGLQCVLVTRPSDSSYILTFSYTCYNSKLFFKKIEEINNIFNSYHSSLLKILLQSSCTFLYDFLQSSNEKPEVWRLEFFDTQGTRKGIFSLPALCGVPHLE